MVYVHEMYGGGTSKFPGSHTVTWIVKHHNILSPHYIQHTLLCFLLYTPISLFTMTRWYCLDLSSAFAAIPNTNSAPSGFLIVMSVGRVVTWLVVILLSESTKFIPHSEIISGVPQGSVLALHLFIYLLLSFAFLLSTQSTFCLLTLS